MLWESQVSDPCLRIVLYIIESDKMKLEYFFLSIYRRWIICCFDNLWTTRLCFCYLGNHIRVLHSKTTPENLLNKRVISVRFAVLLLRSASQVTCLDQIRQLDLMKRVQICLQRRWVRPNWDRREPEFSWLFGVNDHWIH